MYKKLFKYLKPNKQQHQCELKASTGLLLLLCQPFCVQSDPVTYTLANFNPLFVLNKNKYLSN